MVGQPVSPYCNASPIELIYSVYLIIMDLETWALFYSFEDIYVKCSFCSPPCTAFNLVKLLLFYWFSSAEMVLSFGLT